MIGEIDIAGVFVPTLLVWMLATVALGMALRTAMLRLRLYRFVWHPGLFDLCMQVVLLAAVTAVSSGRFRP
jgi:hypothetical protein